MKNVLIIIVYFCICNVMYSIAKPENLTLELLQVLFRHGDRFPDKSERKIDKSDKYNDIFKNFGDYGKLTKSGMLREYNFGKMLRERYDDFLGAYKPAEVYAQSTDFDRTKMTLLLALAGLYPPTEKTCWSDEVNWSPIPIHYNPRKTDFLRVTINGDCVQKGKLLAEIDNLPEVKSKKALYQDLFEKMKNNTLIQEFRFKDMFRIYAYITSLLAMDLSLPDWCTEEDYKKLEEATGFHYESLGLTAAFRKATAGPTIDQFLQNINKKESKKIYLFAAHEINIATFVQAHNFTGIPLVPDFGSGVIVEKLRGDDDKIYLQMFYWTGVSAELIPIKLESCDHVCLLEKYSEAVKPMIPSEEDKMCFSFQRFCKKDNKN